MPELPDITLYVEHLERRLAGATLERVRVMSPNLLRTADPPAEEAAGRRVAGVWRQGKRIVIELEQAWFLVLHLMIAGRLHWKDAPAVASDGGVDAPGAAPPKRGARASAKTPAARAGRTLPLTPDEQDRAVRLAALRNARGGLGKNGLAAFEFSTGTLTLTEASTRQRAGLWVIRGRVGVNELDRGGLEPLEIDRATFAAALARENHTLKRGLTDPRAFSGIGNAYSDEILHRARLSPMQWTSRLTDEEVTRLYEATREVLWEWIARLRERYGAKFPEKVTAFQPGMAVHGRHREPCPVCGAPVQRIVYADNETNYCARCQTGGRVLADRALSRLLRDDWPRTLEEQEGL